MRPDFSPAMLAVFLRARAHMAVSQSGEPARRTAIVRATKDRIRKQAGVTATEMHFAWMGWLPTPETRARLWAVLGHHPGDHGVTLTHGGQEFSVLTGEALRTGRATTPGTRSGAGAMEEAQAADRQPPDRSGAPAQGQPRSGDAAREPRSRRHG